jgi:hypothetical protein
MRRAVSLLVVLFVLAAVTPQTGLAQGNTPPNPPAGAPAIGGAAFGQCAAAWVNGSLTVFGVPLGQFLAFVGGASVIAPVGTEAQLTVIALKIGAAAPFAAPCP